MPLRRLQEATEAEWAVTAFTGTRPCTSEGPGIPESVDLCVVDKTEKLATVHCPDLSVFSTTSEHVCPWSNLDVPSIPAALEHQCYHKCKIAGCLDEVEYEFLAKELFPFRTQLPETAGEGVTALAMGTEGEADLVYYAQQTVAGTGARP